MVGAWLKAAVMMWGLTSIGAPGRRIRAIIALPSELGIA
jgi:hypothetical protein